MKNSWIGLEPLEPRALFSAGPFHYNDADGDRYSVTLRGPGTMLVTQDDPDFDGRGALTSIQLLNTTGASSLLVKGATRVGSITGDALGEILAKKLLLTGAGVDLGGDPGDKTRITLGGLGVGANIHLDGTLESLRLSHVDSGTVIEAARAGSVIVTGTFAGTLLLTDAGASRSLDLLQAGTLNGARVRAASTIGRVVAKQSIDSTLFAGIDPAQEGLPDDAGDFVNKSASIESVTIKGGYGNEPWLSNTHIAAWTVGLFSAGNAQPDNGGTAYGLATNHAGLFQYESPDVSVKLRNAESTDVLFRDGDLTLRFFETVG